VPESLRNGSVACCTGRGFLARQDLGAVEVASIGDDIEALPPQRVFGLLGHAGELRPGRCLIPVGYKRWRAKKAA